MAFGQMGVLGTGFGRMGTGGGAAVDPLAPSAPIILWDGDTADNTPDFVITIDDTVIQGDDIEVWVDGVLSSTHSITAGEDLANSIALALAAMGNGTYQVKMRGIHYDPPGTPHIGAFSNVESVTITAGPTNGILLEDGVSFLLAENGNYLVQE